ncbi:hypothetical protein L9F63_021154, partial [Diploptera punctata]
VAVSLFVHTRRSIFIHHSSISRKLSLVHFLIWLRFYTCLMFHESKSIKNYRTKFEECRCPRNSKRSVEQRIRRYTWN